MPQSHLSRALGLSRSYVSLVIRELERLGLVQRIKMGNTFIVKLASPSSPSLTSKVLPLGLIWSSEYGFLGHFAKRLREALDLEVQVRVYPNALHATMALVRGEVLATLSPLVTQLYAYTIFKDMVIVGGGARGGSAVYELPRGEPGCVIASAVSTMDLCRLLATREGLIEASSVHYFNSPEEALALSKQGRARYAVLWHPLTEHLRAVEPRKVVDCAEFDEVPVCCTLAMRASIGWNLVERVARLYRESLERFKEEPSRMLEWYSAVVGIESALLKRALTLYEYEAEFNLNDLDKVVDSLKVVIPHRSELRKALLPS